MCGGGGGDAGGGDKGVFVVEMVVVMLHGGGVKPDRGYTVLPVSNLVEFLLVGPTRGRFKQTLA